MPILIFFAICLCIGVIKSAADGSKRCKAKKRIKEEIRLSALAEQQKIREKATAQAEKMRKAWERDEQNRISAERKAASEAERTERQLDDLYFANAQSIRDITHHQKMLSNLDAQRDALAMQQDAAPAGSQAWDDLQTKLIRIDRQIHATEKALELAKHKKATSEKRIETLRKRTNNMALDESLPA